MVDFPISPNSNNMLGWIRNIDIIVFYKMLDFSYADLVSLNSQKNNQRKSLSNSKSQKRNNSESVICVKNKQTRQNDISLKLSIIGVLIAMFRK